MNRIKLLSIETSNKIAAGEVVERPASVVKELMENSIDAKSSNISIEILEGGQKSIRISDDGNGINPEDVEKAFLPHATSKISNIEDIYKINTMGFRGEALASIASVSETILSTKIEELNYGKEIKYEGGLLQYVKETGCSVGTTVEVNNLFYNVPARLKFMKSAQREAALISDIISRLAIANPDISIKLISGSTKTIHTYGNGVLLDTIRSIYGKSICDNIAYFEKHNDVASVYGYIGNADISRGSRNNQSIFVNKRYIKNKMITAAVENAFKSFLTIKKFPFFILFIDIYPELIDVNVHPTKSELKFKDDRLIFKYVFDAVHWAIRDNLNNTFHVDFGDEKKTEYVIDKSSDESIIAEKVQIPIDFNTDYNAKDKIETSSDLINKEVPIKEPKFGKLKVMGQFNKTYIICSLPDELYLIDQHAAHEKVMFEKYVGQIKNASIKAQILLTPEIMELSFDDYSYYTQYKELFSKTGFVIDVFGENTINIKEVPLVLGNSSVKSLFMEIIDNIKNMGKGQSVEVKYSKIATIACKSAVKANDVLSMDEMNALVEELRYLEDPFTCPHGRPTIIKITQNELEKRFKRIQ